GGVIQSLDAGESWRYVSKGEAETFRPVSRVTGVYQDCHVVRLSFQDPDSLIVSTGDGLYRSDDCGKSWRRLDRGYRMKKYFGPVVLHPHEPNIIYTAASAAPPSGSKNESSNLQKHRRWDKFQGSHDANSAPLYRRMERSGNGSVGR